MPAGPHSPERHAKRSYPVLSLSKHGWHAWSVLRQAQDAGGAFDMIHGAAGRTLRSWASILGQIGKHVAARSIARQGLHPEHAADGELAIEMREQRAVAGRLPYERLPQGIAIDGDELQIIRSCEVQGRGCGHLRRRREVDVAVAQVDGRAPEHAGSLGLRPFGRATDLEDDAQSRLGASVPRAPLTRNT